MVLVDGAFEHLLLLQRNDYWALMAVSLLESGMTLRMITSAVQFFDTLKAEKPLQSNITRR
jgi:uncharacterized membrane protein